MLESMRKQQVKYLPVERASIKGDRVTVDFLGKLDGVAFAGGEGKDMPVVIGSGRAVADFEAALDRHVSAGEIEDRAGDLSRQLRQQGPGRQDRRIRPHGEVGGRGIPAAGR